MFRHPPSGSSCLLRGFSCHFRADCFSDNAVCPGFLALRSACTALLPISTWMSDCHFPSGLLNTRSPSLSQASLPAPAGGAILSFQVICVGTFQSTWLLPSSPPHPPVSRHLVLLCQRWAPVSFPIPLLLPPGVGLQHPMLKL